MKGFIVLLFSGLLIASIEGQASGDWLSDLLDNVHHTQEQIQRNVNAQLQQANQNLNVQLKQVNQNVQEAVRNAKEAAANGSIINTDSGSVIINSGLNGGSSSRQVWHSKDKDGNTYYKDQDVLVFGDTLYQTQRYYNPATKKLEIKIFTRDARNPNAQLVPLTACEA